MQYGCYQESSVIHGWFVYWVSGWEMRRLSEFGNPISDGIVFVFHLHHMLVNCTEINSLWEKIISWWNHQSGDCYLVDELSILYGYYPEDKKTLIFNYYILLGKRYVFTQRFEQKTPNIDLYGNLSCAYYKF